MDENIKQSIDSRKNALSASFEIDAGMQKKVDALFNDIEKLGAKCKDVGEFETEFAKSPLNQKYMDLFTEVATKTALKGAAVGALESAADDVIRKVVPTRAAVHQKAYDEVRKVPGLGDAIDIGEKASYAGHLAKLFGKKKKEGKKD